MKKLILIIALFAIWSDLRAQDSAKVLIKWNYNIEPDVSNYMLLYGLESGNYSKIVNVGNTNRYWIDSLKHFTTYYFVITAVDTAGNESGYSKECSLKTNSPLKSDFDNNGRVGLEDLNFFVSQWGLAVY